jgi:hypothetical protein
MARGSQGAAGRKALKALKPEKKTVPAADEEPPAVKRGPSRPPKKTSTKKKRDPYQSVNELCVLDGYGYVKGMPTHRTHSHVVR